MIDLEHEARDASRPDHLPPRARDAVAAVAAFVILPPVIALVLVGAYLASVPR